MGCTKSNDKREVCSNTNLPKEARETTNKQAKLTPKATRKKRAKKPKVSTRKEIIKRGNK